MPPTGVHFNGSVNLADAETVMREIVSRIPAGLRRIPDGETGDRGNWVFFQLQKFLQSPSLAEAHPHDNPAEDYEMPQVQLAEGVDPSDMTWPDPGYANAYLQSYMTFAALRDQGVTPPGVDTVHQAVRSAAIVLPKEQPFIEGCGDALTVRPGEKHASV